MRRKAYISVLAAMLLALFLPASLEADELRLNSGKVLRGEYRGISGRNIRFHMDGRTILVPMTSVRKLMRGPRAGAKPKPRKSKLRRSKSRPSKAPRLKKNQPVKSVSVKTVANSLPVGKPEIKPTRLDAPSVSREIPTRESAFYQYFVPGWVQINEGRPWRGWLLAGLFAGAILRAAYFSDLLDRDLVAARRDPLYNMYLAPRGALFDSRHREIRLSFIAAALVYAVHGLELGLNYSDDTPDRSGPVLRIKYSLRF